jgi:hypothetical protein
MRYIVHKMIYVHSFVTRKHKKFYVYCTRIGFLNASTTGVLTSNCISIEKISISVKLLMLKYCSEKFFKKHISQFYCDIF